MFIRINSTPSGTFVCMAPHRHKLYNLSVRFIRSCFALVVSVEKEANKAIILRHECLQGPPLVSVFVAYNKQQRSSSSAHISTELICVSSFNVYVYVCLLICLDPVWLLFFFNFKLISVSAKNKNKVQKWRLQRAFLWPLSLSLRLYYVFIRQTDIINNEQSTLSISH